MNISEVNCKIDARSLYFMKYIELNVLSAENLSLYCSYTGHRSFAPLRTWILIPPKKYICPQPSQLSPQQIKCPR